MPPVLIRRALIMCLSACVSIWQSVHPSILLVFLPYFYVFFCPLVYPSFLLPTHLSFRSCSSSSLRPSIRYSFIHPPLPPFIYPCIHPCGHPLTH